MGVAGVISGRLAEGELVIIDGGMGSQLQAEGVPMDEVAWSARANLERPDVVQALQKMGVQAKVSLRFGTLLLNCSSCICNCHSTMS